MTTIVIASSNAANLREALATYKRTGTVEAEYGDDIVTGSEITRAHHAPKYAANPSPCTFPNATADDVELDAIGLSHIDLDSVGGTLALMSKKPGPDSFWRLAGLVDIRGPHRLTECQKAAEATDDDVRSLWAYWAWARSPNGRVALPQDGSVKDVTQAILNHQDILRHIFKPGTTESILARDGEQLASGEAELNESSFVEANEYGVIARVSPNFVNHLYSSPDGVPGRAVVAFGTRAGSITVSFVEAPKGGQGAREIVQKLWGPEAGGHAGIADSPRGQRMTLADLGAAVDVVSTLLSGQPS